MPMNPKLKKLGQKAVDASMRVAKEVKRAAENTAANANKVMINAELHNPRIESNDIFNEIIANYDKIELALTNVQSTISVFQVTLEALERDAKDLKENKEILEQLRVIRDGVNQANSFAEARGAMFAIQMIQKRMLELDVVMKAQQERDSISNAPKESDYSRADAKALANAAIERIKEYQTTISEASKAAVDAEGRLNNIIKPALEGHLQNARQALTALQARQANIGNSQAQSQQAQEQAPAVDLSSPQVAENAAANVDHGVDRKTYDAMQRQLATVQAEIESLRAAAGLNNASNLGVNTVTVQSGTLYVNSPQAAALSGHVVLGSQGSLSSNTASSLQEPVASEMVGVKDDSKAADSSADKANDDKNNGSRPAVL